MTSTRTAAGDALPGGRVAALRPALALMLLLAATLASVALQGFDFPIDNNAFHVPVVLDYVDSAEGPNDTFHQSLRHYVSGLWPTLSLIATEANIYWVFLGVHLLARFAVAILLWRLAVALGGGAAIAALFPCAILFFDSFLGKSPLGHSEVLVAYLTHTQVVIPAVLGAWWLALRRRFAWAGAALGLAFNINAFAAIWGAVALGAAMIVATRRAGLGALVATISRSGAACLAVASPTLVWILRTLAEAPPHEPFSFAAYERAYYGLHSFIDMQWRAAAFFALTIAVAGLAIVRVARDWDADKRAVFLALFATYAVVIVLGAPALYLFDSRIVLALNPLRMDSYVIYLLGIAVLAWCARAYGDGQREDAATDRAFALIALFSLINGNLALLLAVVVLAPGVRLAKFGTGLAAVTWVALAAAGTGFGIAPAIDAQTGWAGVLAALIQALVITYYLMKSRGALRHAALLVALAGLGLLPASGHVVAVVLLGAIYGAGFVYLFFGRQTAAAATATVLLVVLAGIELSWSLAALAAAMLALPLVALVPGAASAPLLSPPKLPDRVVLSVLVGTMILGGVLQMVKRGGLSHAPAEMRDYVQVQLWARRHTPPHTLFLPVGFSGFATLSRRPVWVDWQSGGMVMVAPETYRQWASRWDRLKRVDSLASARALAESEGIPYIVFARQAVASKGVAAACIVYENTRFWIMTLSPALCRDTAAR